jgi:hypothetical protein
MGRKIGGMSTNAVLGIMVVLVLSILATVYLTGDKQQLTAVQTEAQIDQGVVSQCDSTTTPDLNIRAYDKENVGTALTEGTNLYRIKGTTNWAAFTAGTAVTNLPVGAVLEVVMGISTSDFTDNAYGKSFEVTVPCKELTIQDMEMMNDEIETSLSATFYNKDGNAAAQTYVAGQTETVSVKLKSGSDEVFGNPYLPDATAGVICVPLNSTTWDKPEQVYLSDGTELSSVSKPQRHAATAGNTDYCYEIPAITDKTVEIFFDLNADDANAPATDESASIYAANWYINAESGALEFGVENEEGTAVGTDAADTVTFDFT